MDSSQTTISEEPEAPSVDEETLRREREEARQKWLAEQRKKYPVAPDGKFCPLLVLTFEYQYRACMIFVLLLHLLYER